ncbi:crosslink repair DNA glycosylase YcaQ family protein [Micromonospora sp. NPDC049679]|uniref:DNA glycosylase AlkZ-like family protein n=1 Tax=Micromonospora sp. NPDC049679 TaxID=3155920 RepID=UPI0033E9306C
MDMTKLRAWWWHRQGLDGALGGATPAEVLSRTGWARSVGGVNPYLTLFARAGVHRGTVDAAVEALEIYELPSARGCTYVLPAEHFALGLQLGRGAAEVPLRTLARLGVERAEIERLCADVVTLLDGRTLDPAKLKAELGEAVRTLGEEGRKRGQATTLPAALGLLQAAGEIRRVPSGGRLDNQRYAYTRWSVPPTGLDDAAARAELARLYFHWTGAATLAHFRWFSAFTVAAAKAAVAGLDLVDLGDGLLAPADLAAEYAAFAPPPTPRYALLAGIDALLLLRRDVPSLLDAPDAECPIPGAPDRRMGMVPDLPDHPIVDRGRVIGLWQYDVAAEEVVWWLFGGATPERDLAATIARTGVYIRDELGDARSFSLDSPQSRAPRIAALRAG